MHPFLSALTRVIHIIHISMWITCFLSILLSESVSGIHILTSHYFPIVQICEQLRVIHIIPVAMWITLPSFKDAHYLEQERHGHMWG